MEKAILKNEVREYEDEIDLVDLLKILIKNKGLILLITIIITASSLGGALYIRSNRIDKFQQNFILRDYTDSYYSEKAKLVMKSFNVEEMLLNDKIVNKFYDNEDFKRYYLEKTKSENITLDGKRKFLKNSIELKSVTEEGKGKETFKYYTVNTMIEDEALSKKIINLYLSLVNIEKTEIIKSAIESKSYLVFQRRDLYGKKVKEDEKKIAKLIKKQPASILENQSVMSIIAITNPTLLQEMNNNKALYGIYYNQAVGIEGLREDKDLNQQIEKLSSIYKVEEKGKSKLIVAIGIMLGLLLGIFIAFMKEFFENLDLEEGEDS